MVFAAWPEFAGFQNSSSQIRSMLHFDNPHQIDFPKF